MSIQLSNRVQRVKPSPTLAMSALAQKMKAEGRDVINLGVGEPDFGTPEHIKLAAIAAINDNKTGYTAVDGISELKQAIIAKFKNDNQLEYAPDQILVSCGGKQSFSNLCQALLNDGDEVIIPAPYWVSYPDMVLLAGGEPVIVEADQKHHFKLKPELLENAITDKTRLFVINSPSNPTGVNYSYDELAALGQVLLKYPNIIVATDDMYEHILFNNAEFSNILNTTPELYDRCIVLNGVSKAYAMTGWRIGYAAGPADLIKGMKKIQSQSTSNPTSISQYASVAALNSSQDCIIPMLVEFKKRHDYVVSALNAIDGIECLESDGTFYCFPNVSGLIDRIDGVSNSAELSEFLLSEKGIALVPGSAFGLEGHIRLSFATSMDNLEKAIERIASL
ncbi:pyridoxal phosphate-dependent aminotransferase [Cocleimonas sp. KMM 6892]|uniref:pyridoxal phosphate-dependent aminotransferase n=1 Tax=unclassified Cocleimonas TaxID=2639732 RepID=UPI002DBFFAB3|nr:MULTISPECIES: pyridoxal phosphate-dependent aminotransferase [unclassified Cocleimonas]MEB8432215.1 pyridoxal phosphate-dependent aminotransferase [Cocleimonas sp. KMM 6892]MEC4714699.1 pyridoxal phosphate-dependent aminotransferase [Cocleimonas sp. KMM 6895]MEC4744487.1 pyridoxal phosphate-dependent aminotransferase [Cocleimonas sp. KMM 6896]